MPSYCITPEQTPSSCECAYNRTARPLARLPRCAPTVLCDASAGGAAGKAAELLAHPNRVRRFREPRLERVRENSASFVIVYYFNRTRVRYWYRPDPFRSYLNHMRLIARLILSLRDTRTTLPISLLLSGERHITFEEGLVRELGVRILAADDADRHRIKVPHWASAFHWGSFVKLAVLSLTQFERIIVLDADVTATRPRDRMNLRPSPAVPLKWQLSSLALVCREDIGRRAA